MPSSTSSGHLPGRFERALERIDAANAADPRRVDTAGGEQPRELIYGRRMSGWLERLEPSASELLRLAARAQHLGRWRIPREDYPPGRQGYLSWRRSCAELHARLVSEILVELGYEPAAVDRVGFLVRKQGLPEDAEAVALEDAACLVFLEHELAEFAARHDREKVVRILKRTWRKMSPAGRRAALGLHLPEAAQELLAAARSS